MTEAQAAKILLIIEGAYPGRFESTEKTIKAWAALLGDVPYELAEQAAAALCRTNKFPPSVAEIRGAIAEAFSPLPSVEEAYETARRVARDYSPYTPIPDNLHPMVARALDIVGIETMAYTHEPTVIAAQFRRVYENLREREIVRRQQGDAALIPAPDNVRQLADARSKAVTGRREALP